MEWIGKKMTWLITLNLTPIYKTVYNYPICRWFIK